MKILAQAVKDNHIFGFKELFESRRHQWIWWEESHAAAFDVFDEVQPDLFIGCGEISKAVKKCLNIYRHKTKAMYQTGPYTYQVGDNIWSYPLLVNTNVHQPGHPNLKLLCEIGCCEAPHPHLLYLCGTGKFRIKIIGPTRWPVPQYVGTAQWQELIMLYQSAKLVYANQVEEIGRAIACNTCVVTSNNELPDFFTDLVYPASDAFELYDTCHQLLTSRDGERITHASLGHKRIVESELTYKKAFEDVCEALKTQGIKV